MSEYVWREIETEAVGCFGINLKFVNKILKIFSQTYLQTVYQMSVDGLKSVVQDCVCWQYEC